MECWYNKDNKLPEEHKDKNAYGHNTDYKA